MPWSEDPQPSAAADPNAALMQMLRDARVMAASSVSGAKAMYDQAMDAVFRLMQKDRRYFDIFHGASESGKMVSYGTVHKG